jgi:YidC/Oxa1 family membrane protein insertase
VCVYSRSKNLIQFIPLLLFIFFYVSLKSQNTIATYKYTKTGVRSLLVPLSVQQSKSTEYNKALQPYILEINEKFKDNEQRKNQAVGKLYEDANQNPLSGCLLSLFQLPIFLGLYRGVRLLALDGVLDEKFLWIPSLQGPVTAETDFRGMDWLTQGWTQNIDSGMWTPSLGWETTLAFCIMPVLLVLGQKLTMTALSPPDIDDGRDDVDEASMSKEEKEAKDQADTTKNVLKFLPLLIGFFSLQVPAALTIYWFTSNGFTLAQSLAVRKYYESNPPVIELPDYWDDLSDDENEMTSEKRRAAAKAGISKGPSLDDWILNCKYHTVVERQPIRESSNAWLQIEGYNSTKKLIIPAEFQSWVSSTCEVPDVNGGNGHGTADTSATEEEASSAETVPAASS